MWYGESSKENNIFSSTFLFISNGLHNNLFNASVNSALLSNNGFLSMLHVAFVVVICIEGRTSINPTLK